MKLYDELVPWYYLIDPTEDHAAETASFVAAFARAAAPAETLLELGAGAGNNAEHLKARFRCTLSDLSPAMLALSEGLNPQCEHVPGDMRSLRLGRAFDAVLVHDAVMYMLSEDDLLAAARTAFVHTRPGGAAIFAPDCVTETFEDATVTHGNEAGERAVQMLEWSWDPDRDDQQYNVDYAFLLREGRKVTAVHDSHVEGLFSRDTWIRILQTAGFRVELTPRDWGDGRGDHVFLCRREAPLVTP